MDDWIKKAFALYIALAGLAMVGVVAIIGAIVWRSLTR